VWRWIANGGALEALSIWFGAAFTVAVASGLGAICFGKTLKQWPERFVTGAAVLNLAIFALCCLHLAYPILFAALGAVILYLWLKRIPLTRQKLHISNYLLAALFAAYGLLYFFNAMAPEASPDGAAYHLSFVARYLREHGFHPIIWNMYASLSEGAEMLFLFAFAFGKHSAAAMVHFAFLVALVWQMAQYARRAGFPTLGLCAALLVFAAPIVGKDATSAYNDTALAAAAFTLYILLQAWDEERAARLLIPIGLVAGFAYAIKYTGGVAILYAVAFVAWKSWRRSRELRPVLTVATCAALVALPWMFKNWIWVANPISPFFNNLFPNPYVTTWFEKDYRQYFTIYELHSRWQIPWAVTISGRLVGVLGPMFLLAPVALLALRRREGRQLLLAAAVFGSTYFGNIGARFLITPLPFIALAMMLGLGNQTLALAVAALHAVLSWPSIVPKYAHTWSLQKLPFREAMRFKPASEYLQAHLPQYGVDVMLDRVTEPGATVFAYQAIAEAYTSRRVLVDYESADNHVDGVILWTGFLRDWQPNWRAGFQFDRQTLRGFRIVQKTDGHTQWRIHELRAFDGAAALSRGAWRATAKPFPWGINDAVDGKPVTFWESGDPLRAGAYVEANFAAPQALDSVLIETSPNQPELELELYGETASGEWKRLVSHPQIFNASAPDLRRAAVEELKRRGVGYVLLFENDVVTPAVRERGAEPGMVELGESDGARLYRLQ
jgi:hypothetical protein